MKDQNLLLLATSDLNIRFNCILCCKRIKVVSYDTGAEVYYLGILFTFLCLTHPELHFDGLSSCYLLFLCFLYSVHLFTIFHFPFDKLLFYVSFLITTKKWFPDCQNFGTGQPLWDSKMLSMTSSLCSDSPVAECEVFVDQSPLLGLDFMFICSSICAMALQMSF